MSAAIDLRDTIIPKSDQLNADDLIGGPRTVTITRVVKHTDADQQVSVFFEGDGGRPWKPCKSMRRVMIQAWGVDAAAYTGRGMTLFRDPGVKFGGAQVGGIRISHLSHIERDMVMALTETKGKRAPFVVKPLVPSKPKATPADVTARAEKGARELVERIGGAADMAALEAITGDAAVVTSRKWLAQNFPALDAGITDAVQAALARLNAAPGAEQAAA